VYHIYGFYEILNKVEDLQSLEGYLNLHDIQNYAMTSIYSQICDIYLFLCNYSKSAVS
jgi:hypothetical protein